MSTNSFTRSDLARIYNIVQNEAILYPKELVVATLRNFFTQDSYYAYRQDHYGFPQIPDLTDVPLEAGLHDSVTTRLLIGEQYRFDVIYYPALIVRSGGTTSTPISINQEEGGVQYNYTVFQDANGNIATFPTPSHYIFAGAWEGSILIDVMARDLRTRDELVGYVMILFENIAKNDLIHAGLVIKPGTVAAAAPIETQDRSDFVFKQTVTLQVRSEWRRHIPINTVLDVLNFVVEFGNIGPPPEITAPNLTIHNNQTITEILAELGDNIIDENVD